MKDRWMNVGHEEEELKPYAEPEPDFNDAKRIGKCFSIVRGSVPKLKEASVLQNCENKKQFLFEKHLHYHLFFLQIHIKHDRIPYFVLI